MQAAYLKLTVMEFYAGELLRITTRKRYAIRTMGLSGEGDEKIRESYLSYPAFDGRLKTWTINHAEVSDVKTRKISQRVQDRSCSAA